jgi:methionyl-tRNA formyltransferase
VTDDRVRTVFLGSGGFGRESLWRLDGHDDIRLVGVVTWPRDSIIGQAADELGVPAVLAPERLRDRASIDAILALEPDLLVLADYGKIVPSPLLELRHGALNLHPSLLPRHRGATPIPAAILAGDPETGVTLIRMDEGLDTGPIVAQDRITLGPAETAPVLEERLEMVADGLLDRSLGPWIRGEIVPTPQADHGATVTRPLRREDGRLEPSRPAIDLERQVRAYQPWPGSFVETPFGRLIVWSASAGSTGGPDAGTFDDRGLGVGDGERLWLIEVQPAGGKRMPWEAFLRGRPGIVGSRVVTGG